jgi:signal peptidase I
VPIESFFFVFFYISIIVIFKLSLCNKFSASQPSPCDLVAEKTRANFPNSPWIIIRSSVREAYASHTSKKFNVFAQSCVIVTENLPMLFSDRKNRKKLLATIACAGISMVIMAIVASSHKFYVVVSDSMIPNLNTGDIVIIDNGNSVTGSSFVHLEKGDIIVFEVSSQPGEPEEGKRTIVHRVDEISIDSKGQRVIRAKGDANPLSIRGIDYPITVDNYIGKVDYSVPYLGLFLMYLNLLIRIITQPIFYLIIGVVVATIIFQEHQKEKG